MITYWEKTWTAAAEERLKGLSSIEVDDLTQDQKALLGDHLLMSRDLQWGTLALSSRLGLLMEAERVLSTQGQDAALRVWETVGHPLIDGSDAEMSAAYQASISLNILIALEVPHEL